MMKKKQQMRTLVELDRNVNGRKKGRNATKTSQTSTGLVLLLVEPW
jgi:hypothetical protein